MSFAGVFRAQARACSDLGSPFIARVLNIIAENLTPGLPVFDRILAWEGDPTPAGQSVPLRLVGGLHALVLSKDDTGLMAAYPPNPDPSDAALSTAILAAIATHEAILMRWLDSPPQTNEVGRSAVLIAVGQLLAARYGLPLRLLELGASAGLNLQWDRMALLAGGEHFGDAGAALTLSPDWFGPLPPQAELKISTRAGVDLNPLDPTRPENHLRMVSYIWPDQAERLQRMRAALAIANAHPANVDQGDAAPWIANKLAVPVQQQVTVIYHTIAWQYFPKSTQSDARAAIEAAGAAATPDAPVAWLSMETDGRPDGAALQLRLWPSDETLTLGRADFHGRWIKWHNVQATPAEAHNSGQT